MEVRKSISFIANKDYIKLEIFLKEKGISRRIITKLKYIDCLLVNNIPKNTASKVSKNDKVTLLFPIENEISCNPQKGELNIIYEDLDILVLNKACGVATHPAGGTKDSTIANFVTNYYMENGYNIPFRPVSRLDKETSGVIVIAKNKLAHSILSEQMKRGEYKKQYYARVSGNVLNDGEITAPIDREMEGSVLRVCRSDGKNAHTIYRVIEHNKKESLLEIELKTGRTHQIRVHLKKIGHPIIGDLLYGTIIADRLYLHSYKTELIHPVTNEKMVFLAKLEF